MSHNQTRRSLPEDALYDFGDRLAAGDAPAPRDELEATAARIQRTLRSDPFAAQVMPADDARHLVRAAGRKKTLAPDRL